MGGRGRGRGRGKRGRYSAEQEQAFHDMTLPTPPAPRQFTPKIIRTPLDLDTFISPTCTHGSTIIRRLLDNENNVYTRTQQLTHTPLSPIIRTLQSQSQHLSHSETPLYLNSGSHKSTTTEKENHVCQAEQLLAPRMEVSSDVHENENENVGSSSTNNGSKELVFDKSNTLSSSSLNTTQILEDMGFGKTFEAHSLGPVNADLVWLKGYNYKVNPRYVGLLTSILSKHGDIGANCSMVSVTFRSICMEHVCDLVQTLKDTELKVMTNKDLETMMAEITDLEKERVDVRWLRKRLEKISEAQKAALELGESSNLKNLHGEQLTKVERIKEKLEEYKRAIVDLQKKVDLAELDLTVAETQVSETENTISEIKAKVIHVYKLESLAYGLL